MKHLLYLATIAEGAPEQAAAHDKHIAATCRTIIKTGMAALYRCTAQSYHRTRTVDEDVAATLGGLAALHDTAVEIHGCACAVIGLGIDDTALIGAGCLGIIADCSAIEVKLTAADAENTALHAFACLGAHDLTIADTIQDRQLTVNVEGTGGSIGHIIAA